MSLEITPDIIRNAYEYLRSTKPFKHWKLPHSDKIKIKTILPNDKLGEWSIKDKQHCISINDKLIGSTLNLMQTLAHEMIHLAQYILKQETPNTEHNKDFYNKIKIIAKYHGFDSKWF